MKSRAAASLVVAALSVSLAAPAAVAADSSRAPAGAAATGQPNAKPAATSLAALKARLRKAVKAKKKAAAAVASAATKVQAAKDSGTAAIFAHQSASVALEEARTKHATAKAALDRAQGFVSNEDALWADLDKRMAAAQAGYVPLRDAYNAAQARMTELQNAVQALRAQQSTAATSQNEAAVYASGLMTNDIPQAQDRFNAAWANEQSAFAALASAQDDFARRKAQWERTRKVNGHWEGFRDGAWRPAGGLDDAEATVERTQSDYNRAQAQRLDIQGYLNTLNARLADVQAEIARLAALFADLQRQVDAYSQPINNQSATIRATGDAMRAYQANTVDPLYKEYDKLVQDLKDAKAGLPALVAAEKPLADALAQASAALGAATPAYEAAQSAIDAANGVLTTAKAALVKATSTVKKLKKQIRKAKARR